MNFENFIFAYPHILHILISKKKMDQLILSLTLNIELLHAIKTIIAFSSVSWFGIKIIEIFKNSKTVRESH